MRDTGNAIVMILALAGAVAAIVLVDAGLLVSILLGAEVAGVAFVDLVVTHALVRVERRGGSSRTRDGCLSRGAVRTAAVWARPGLSSDVHAGDGRRRPRLPFALCALVPGVRMTSQTS